MLKLSIAQLNSHNSLVNELQGGRLRHYLLGNGPWHYSETDNVITRTRRELVAEDHTCVFTQANTPG